MKRIQNKSETAVIRRAGWFLFCTYALLFLLFASGCGNKFFDPTQIGRFRPVPAVNVILDTLGVAEESPVAWEQAEDPQPSDTVVMESDYVFRSGDIVRISIFELLQDGVPFVNDYVVTETGKISIPEVGVVESAGLTETQLEEEIRQILAPSVLKEPSVVVTLLNSQQRTFSILGEGVPAPGRYMIPRYGFRLTDALATAGGPRQFNVSYIFVSRYVKEKEVIGAPRRPESNELKELELTEPELTEPQLIEPHLIKPQLKKLPKPADLEKEVLEVITPRAQHQWPQSKVVIATSEMITDRELAQANLPEGFEKLSDEQRDWKDTRGKPQSSVGPSAPEPTEEAIKDEPVSVKDILKTLSERSRRERTTGAQTGTGRGAREPGAEPSGPQTTVGLPKDERVEDVPAFPEPPPQEKTNGRAGVKKAEKPSTGVSPTGRERVSERAKVDDILKRLSERRGPEKVGVKTSVEEVAKPSPEPSAGDETGEETNVDAILKSLSERRRPAVGTRVEEIAEPIEKPTGPEKTAEETDIDAMLKSLPERQRPQVGKRVGEAVAPSEEPIGQERLDERIDVDEVLKTLSERPRRERIEAPVEEGVGVEETLKLLAEPGAPEVTGERIKGEVGVRRPSAKPVATGKKVGEETGRIEWIFQDGKWVPVQVGPSKPIEPVIRVEANEGLIAPFEEREGKPVPEFEWEETAKMRLIRIPADKLLAGDSRYNVVIKPGDTIHVPVDIIGEFCIVGNVNSQGYVNITGRPMTLKMAIAAAGGLGPLAWPKTCEVIRRIGKKKEEIVLVDLDKIANGEQPDFFIKPNDLINVGTHSTARWRAVLRNAFRATYGFGFVYDRNFADIDYGYRGITTWF
jgi:protein involved in polysaccharide export with SLBB domain